MSKASENYRIGQVISCYSQEWYQVKWPDAAVSTVWLMSWTGYSGRVWGVWVCVCTHLTLMGTPVEITVTRTLILREPCLLSRTICIPKLWVNEIQTQVQRRSNPVLRP